MTSELFYLFVDPLPTHLSLSLLNPSNLLFFSLLLGTPYLQCRRHLSISPKRETKRKSFHNGRGGRSRTSESALRDVTALYVFRAPERERERGTGTAANFSRHPELKIHSRTSCFVLISVTSSDISIWVVQ